MNIPKNLAKSTLLASVVFWAILVSDDFNFNMIPFVFMSLIPIFICVLTIVLLSICPFFWIAEKNHFHKKRVFTFIFPYYVIVAFAICLFGIYNTDFSAFTTAFFTSASITSSQSWVWFAQENR